MQRVGSDTNGPLARARRCLIIDDSNVVRAALRGILELDLIQVVEANGGAEGVEILRRDRDVGLVFLDLHMPGLDGLKTLRLIRAEFGSAELPVVLLTGSLPQELKDLGVAGWLQKPVRRDAIIEVARSFLGESCETSGQLP